MTIQQCRYVLEIAKTGSFSEAAKQLFIAQSSLSISIKMLEQELNIKIFERSNNGVYLTEDGAEFVRYATQIADGEDFVIKRYKYEDTPSKLRISTQHYDFVADLFGELLNEKEDSEGDYRFALREMKTYDVIHETETAFCDIGIIAIKGNDYSVMDRYLGRRGLTFTPVLKALPHVFVRQEHPLARCSVIAAEDLKDFPFVSYEQGEHNNSFFTEEISGMYSSRQVEISDRASLMNVLLSTNCCTLGTGIMPSALNQGRIVSIPFESDDYYIIGYILRTDRNISPLTEHFIEMLCQKSREIQNKEGE